MPDALPYLYTTEADIIALLGGDGEEASLDDSNNLELSTLNQAALSRAIIWATARINYFLLARYDASDLAQSWIVNDWATICAAWRLRVRRGNSGPGSLRELYEEAVMDLKAVQNGEHNLADIGLRTNGWPAWSNVRVDPLYTLRKIRVERPISEQTAQPRQNRDIPSDYTIEPT